jgi:hypothetical protein
MRTRFLAIAFAVMTISSVPAFGQLVISPSFLPSFATSFGTNTAAAEASWISAANIFSTDFNNNITINISVAGVSGTGTFGASNTSLISSSWTGLRNLLVANPNQSADDMTALGAGGSIPAADPLGGSGTWWVSRAEAKAIGLIAGSDSITDGTTTFGAGNAFTFSGSIAAGTSDFEGVAAHEIAEVMGRIGLKGNTVGSSTNSYTLLDAFSFTGSATRSLPGGAGANFSIDNGTTLLKLYNNWPTNGLDSRDWAPGTNDSFNQFSNSGVINPVTPVDVREMNVIGYNLVPEPSTLALLGVGAIGLLAYRRRQRRAQQVPCPDKS